MPASSSVLLDRALAAHNRGDWGAAQDLYRAILAEEPEHAPATHMLGTLLLQMGETKQAEAVLRRAISLDPHSAEVSVKLGLVLAQQGRFADSIAAYDHALDLKPDHPAALANKANALSAAGRLVEAIACYDAIIALEPEVAANYHNRGIAFERLGDHEEAAVSYRAALQRRPDFPEALNNLGNVRRTMGHADEALEFYARALAHKPGYAEAYVNRAAACSDLRCFAEAEGDLKKALTLDPALPEAWCNLGNVVRETGAIDAALGHYDRALAVRPSHRQARWNQAFTHLLLGRWREGWDGYELRHAKRPKPSDEELGGVPEWAGEALSGRRILLYSEQGLGDAIQFSRFAKLLAEQGAIVTLLVPARLRRLFASLDGVEVVDEVTQMRGFDFWTPLMGLPRFLGVTPERMSPLDTPYLWAEPARIAVWKWRLKDRLGGGFPIGICWQGNPAGSVDSGRSIALSEFAPLARIPGVRLVSLQKGRGSEQLDRLADGMGADGMRVENFSHLDSGPDGFLDTAAIMANLGLVITSDTSVAHLAGALGVPAWVALKKTPDWRWLLHRKDSPWYPTLRLYRQSHLDDWKGVFQDMAKDLSWLLAGAHPDAGSSVS